MYDVQLINRVAWDNNVRWPDANELGWKDTLRINPLQDTIVALRPIAPDVPFDLPNNIRLLDPTMPEGEVLTNSTAVDLGGPGLMKFDPAGEMIDIINHYVNFGWEFTWHCHILAHEEMDMMRPVAVIPSIPPTAPTSLTAVIFPSSVNLAWNDNSLSETNFTIQRANNSAFTTGRVDFTVGQNITSFLDSTVQFGQTYYYRVIANNIIGDTWDYANPAINEAVGFPTLSINSTASNTATPTVQNTQFDFGTVSSPVETGYVQVTHATVYSTGAGYGWASTAGVGSRDRGAPDDLRRDFVYSNIDRTFNIDIANGNYRVTVIIGDRNFAHNLIDVSAEGILKINDLTVPANTFNTQTFTVTVSDGQLNILFHDAGGTDANWIINSLTIQPASTTVQQSIDFGTAGSPTALGYVKATHTTVYSALLGYGWDNIAGVGSRDRGAPDDLRRDFVYSELDRNFNIDLANGAYSVTVIIGDNNFAHNLIDVSAEGILQVNDLTVPKATFSTQIFTVTVSDGQLNILFHDPGGEDIYWVVNAITVQPA
jgi:fibronectin type 3 domain-containing protein